MVTSRAALVCLVAAVVLGIVFHPRVFFGNGSGSGIVNLDGLFFMGQWGAFVLALVALVVSGVAWRNAGELRTVANLVVPTCALVTLVFLLVVGVPHNTNRGEWRNGELGAAAFMRGIARDRKSNASPTMLTADAFRGDWIATDGAVFTFTPTSVLWKAASGNGEHSASACGAPFALRYVQRDRDILQDNGITWSLHANALYDSTAIDAKIPTAEITCGKSESVLFIRASATEVWRWTSSLDLESIKSNAFVLRLNTGNQ